MKVFVTLNDKFENIDKIVLDSGFKPWRISKKFCEQILEDGLKQIEKIHCGHPKTDFQKKLLESLRLYSSSLLLHDFSNRLIYTLTTIESLLLKNRTEAIQDNISRRIAFLIGNDKNLRKEIAKNFKMVYSIRSKFIHHAEQISQDEFNTLKKFIFNVWTFLLMAINDSDKFKTKDEFIDAIEDRIFS